MSNSGKTYLGMTKTEAIGTGATIGAGFAYPQAIVGAVDATAKFVGGALEYAGDAIETVGNEALGALVTPVATGLSGLHLGNRAADIVGAAEDASLRKWLKWGFATAGVAAAASPLAPYLVGGAIASKLGKRPFKWATGLVGRGTTAVIGGTLGPIKDGIKSVPGNIKGGWNYA